MSKVLCIRNTSYTEEAARRLWEAAARVFEIPEWEATVKWLAGGSMPALRQQVTPHIGPSIGLMLGCDGPRGVHVVTDGGRYVDLRRGPYDSWVTVIEFPAPGSIVAAGELVRHAWDVPVDGWAEVVVTGGASVDLDDYPGPMGRDMYLARMGLPGPALLNCARRGNWSLAGETVSEETLPAFLAAVGQ